MFKLNTFQPGVDIRFPTDTAAARLSQELLYGRVVAHQGRQ